MADVRGDVHGAEGEEVGEGGGEVADAFGGRGGELGGGEGLDPGDGGGVEFIEEGEEVGFVGEGGGVVEGGGLLGVAVGETGGGFRDGGAGFGEDEYFGGDEVADSSVGVIGVGDGSGEEVGTWERSAMWGFEDGEAGVEGGGDLVVHGNVFLRKRRGVKVVRLTGGL